MRSAAAAAGAEGAIAGLPGGYDTQLGKWFLGGQELSLGQWQKIALARAFYRDAPPIVLDEPTAGLDALAQAELFSSFRRLIAGRTALLISHRFSSVRMADRIHVFAEGRVVESGDHRQLMERDGGCSTSRRGCTGWSSERPLGPDSEIEVVRPGRCSGASGSGTCRSWYPGCDPMSDTELLSRFAIALAIGFVVGLQREHAHADEDKEKIFAGVRTFPLLALIGCASALLADEVGSAWVLSTVLLLIGALVVATYAFSAARGYVGITTESAALLTVLVGALCYAGRLGIGWRRWLCCRSRSSSTGWLSASLARTWSPPSSSGRSPRSCCRCSRIAASEHRRSTSSTPTTSG